jgi:DNA (cytosine-5)-methyltransferase 3A
MRVLSLFDGISCGRVALERAGIEVETYYASEIDKHAIAVSTKNYPDIVQLGSVVGLTPPDNIDLLIGGSPCQDLSIAKKDRKGLDGDRSGLFWEYVRIKEECKPTYFILENVASMPKKDRDLITITLGVQPVLFNSSLVSAQCRKRLFWTNLKFDLPEDRGILLKDILQPDAEVDERMMVDGKAFTLTATYSKVSASDAQVENSIQRKQRTMVKVGHIGKNDAQANRVYNPDGKSCTLSANGGGLGAKTGLYCIGRDVGRRLNEDGKRDDDNTNLPYQRRIETRMDGKCGTLTSVQKDNLVVGEHIRKLTPIECERLQSLPDNYTEGIAKTNRYKCLGNAFNVDVVSHILSVLHNG